jgi:hypothetical protein
MSEQVYLPLVVKDSSGVWLAASAADPESAGADVHSVFRDARRQR